MRIILLTLILSFALLPLSILHAQEEKESNEKIKTNFYLFIGYQQTDASAFSNSWQPGTFGNIKAPQFSLAFGTSYFYPKFMFNWEFVSYISGSNRSTDYQSRLNAFEFNVNAGYPIINKPDFKLYPSVGIGIGGGTFDFESRNTNITNAGDLFEINSAQINNFYIPVPLALNADYFFTVKEKTKLNLGISVGYNLAFVVDGWRQTNRVIGSTSGVLSEPGDFSAEGLFIRARIGFWSKP